MTIAVMGIIARCEIEGCPNGFHITPSNVHAVFGHSIDARRCEEDAIRLAGWHTRNGHDFCSQECLDKYGAGSRVREDSTVRDMDTFPVVFFTTE